jgi:hypothetical protein
VDGPTGKNKEGLVVKNIREEFSLMLDQLQWMDSQLGKKNEGLVK